MSRHVLVETQLAIVSCGALIMLLPEPLRTAYLLFFLCDLVVGTLALVVMWAHEQPAHPATVVFSAALWPVTLVVRAVAQTRLLIKKAKGQA